VSTRVNQTVKGHGGKGGITVTFGDVSTTETRTKTTNRTSSYRVVKGSGNKRGDTMTEAFARNGRGRS
jgi:hypothetical protein